MFFEHDSAKEDLCNGQLVFSPIIDNFQLIPFDFVNLSLTCRFLHWRIFTFCTCYAPYKVVLKIEDLSVSPEIYGFIRSNTMPKCVYFFDGDASKLDDSYDDLSKRRYAYLARGSFPHRGLFVLQPDCLKRPFKLPKTKAGGFLIQQFTKSPVTFIRRRPGNQSGDPILL